MEEKTLFIPSISCGHCVMTIKRGVEKLKGVISVEVDANTKEVAINWDIPATWEKITQRLKEIGYPAK